MVFATGAFFFFGLLNGFFLPFFTNFLAFSPAIPFTKFSPDDSDSSAESGLLTGSVVPTGSGGDGGNGFIDPSLSLSTPGRVVALDPCVELDGPWVNEVPSSAALAISAAEFPATPATVSSGAGAV